MVRPWVEISNGKLLGIRSGSKAFFLRNLSEIENDGRGYQLEVTLILRHFSGPYKLSPGQKNGKIKESIYINIYILQFWVYFLPFYIYAEANDVLLCLCFMEHLCIYIFLSMNAIICALNLFSITKEELHLYHIPWRKPLCNKNANLFYLMCVLDSSLPLQFICAY